MFEQLLNYVGVLCPPLDISWEQEEPQTTLPHRGLWSQTSSHIKVFHLLWSEESHLNFFCLSHSIVKGLFTDWRYTKYFRCFILFSSPGISPWKTNAQLLLYDKFQ